MSKNGFQNQSYDDEGDGDEIELLERKDSNPSTNEENVNRVLLEFDGVEEALNELDNEEENEVLDFRHLNFFKISLYSQENLWRYGPAPIDDMDDVLPAKIAVLEGPLLKNLGDISTLLDKTIDAEERNATASMALISYFAQLGTTDSHSKIDLPFLEILLQSANINVRDVHGQSIFHEVAREWNVEFAYFLKLKGCDINAKDNWGRTPLIVATAANHHDIVRWLLENGAELKHRTMKGEGQSAIHYAAKYDALDAFKVLVEMGADPIERDDRNRTPFFLAAEQGLPSICEYMLELGLPTASYNDVGVSVIDHIVTKLPIQLVTTAFNQFIVVEKQYRRKKSYLSCLTKRRWRLLTNSTHCHSNYDPPTPLELIVQQNDLELVRHPIILELIELKRNFFGFKFNCINIFLYLLFTVIWTIAVSLPIGRTDDIGGNEKTALVLSVIGEILTILFAIKLFFDYRVHSRAINETKQKQLTDFKNEYKFCHPRWGVEEKILERNAQVVGRFSLNYWADGWNIIEGLCLVMSTIEMVITILFIARSDTKNIETIHNIFSALFVLILWLRVNRAMRIIGSLGPFIAMLGECVIATARFAFLFFEFFIPFSVAFWVIFGGERRDENGDLIGGEYESFNDMLYQLYLLTIVGDYEYGDLQTIDKITSQILVGLYFILVSVISLNLFIALLSEAVARVNETASATAYMKEAEMLITIERQFPEVKREFDIYINKQCAPKIRPVLIHPTTPDRNAREVVRDLSKNVRKTSTQLHQIIQEQQKMKNNLDKGQSTIQTFGTKYSKPRLEEIWKEFEDVYNFHVSRLNQLHRKTRNRVTKFFTSGKDSFL